MIRRLSQHIVSAALHPGFLQPLRLRSAGHVSKMGVCALINDGAQARAERSHPWLRLEPATNV